MQGFKRNQIEEAISRVFNPKAVEPSAELRTRVKRLLEADRALGQKVRSKDPAENTYAFYSRPPPGSGVEVWFSGYEAFALAIGLRLMQHGWPQSFAVSVMRRVRPVLEIEHARTLKQDRETLFDQDAIRRNAQSGDFAFDNTDPVLLIIISVTPETENDEFPGCRVFRGTQKAAPFVYEQRGRAWTMFELATAAHLLSDQLLKTVPRSRGRGG